MPIASSADGVNILLDNRLMHFINELSPIDPVPVLLEDSLSVSAGGDLASMRLEAEDLVDEALTPVLRVLRAMLASSPLCIPLLEGCALYLHRNAEVVKHLLSLKMNSLKGLTLVKNLVSVISVMSAYKSPRSSDINSHAPSKIAISDIFMYELGGLLHRIGSSPIPGLHQADSWSQVGGGKHAVWWTSIQPCSEHDWSLVALPSTSPLSLNVATNAVRQTMSGNQSVSTTGLGLNRTWSEYDAIKLQLGHQILESVASILRSTSSTSGSLLSSDFDIGIMSEVFCCCAELNITKSYAGEKLGMVSRNKPKGHREENKPGNGENWLTSTNPVLFSKGNSAPTGFGLSAVANLAARAAGIYSADAAIDIGTSEAGTEGRAKAAGPSAMEGQSEVAGNAGVASLDSTLSFVAENLICAIYSISLNMASKDIAAKSSDLQACLRICEEFPDHSFISEVGRWLGKAI